MVTFDDEEGWDKDDPSAPNYFGSGPPTPTPIELLKKALDTMLEGKHYTKNPEWYKDVFQIHWDSEPTSEPDYLKLLSRVGDSDRGNLIGYTLGTLCEMDSNSVNSCFESFAETNQNDRDSLKKYMRDWILAVAPVLSIYKVEADILTELCKNLANLEFVDLSDAWIQVESGRVKPILDAGWGWALYARNKPSPTHVMVGYKEVRGEPPYS